MVVDGGWGSWDAYHCGRIILVWHRTGNGMTLLDCDDRHVRSGTRCGPTEGGRTDVKGPLYAATLRGFSAQHTQLSESQVDRI
jgi:hypothetical protein